MSSPHVLDISDYEPEESPSGPLTNGGKSIANTGSAIVLGTGSISRIVIAASSTNNGSIFVGSATVTNDYGLATSGYELQPGQAVGILTSNLSNVFINGTTGDSVSFVGN